MSDKLLYTAFLLLSGCATQPPSVSHDELLSQQSALKRVWMITELTPMLPEQLLAKQAHLDWRTLPQATASLGGETLQYQVHADNGRCHIRALTPVHSQTHSLEHAFNTLMNHCRWYRLEGHFLTLITQEGKVLRLVAQDWD